MAIARAVANEARLILADEPTGALQSADTASVIGLLRDLHAAGSTVVMVTHDPEVAAVAQRRLEIRDGQVREVA